MLELILCTNWMTGRDEILRQLSQDVAQRKGGRILMVPELISHDMERRLCAAAGDTASRYAEVLSFTRLARRVCDSVGNAAAECLDAGGRVVAMAAATRQLHSKLKAYASVETRPEFLSGLVDAVDEFKRCCISATDLKNASGQTDGAFAQKLEELSLILETYDALCARGKQDPRDQMSWVLEQMEDSGFGESHEFYIDGFPDFTRQHFAVIEYFIRTSNRVVVSLNCDSVDSGMLAFEKAGSTALALVRSAKDAGIPCVIRHLEPEQTPFSTVCLRLFQGQADADPLLKDKLLLRRSDSVFGECRAAAERITRLVHGGARYRDIAVVCTDMQLYGDTLQLVFDGCEIPVYRSGTDDILQKPVIVTVISALDAALGGYQRDDVMRYLKSALSPLDNDTCDALENYVILWGIDYGKWESEWTNHPDGLGAEQTPESDERLAALNRARVLALAPVFQLRRSFRAAKKLSEQVDAVCEFLDQIGLAERLSLLADELDEANNHREVQILNQLWDILLSALEQLYGVLGDTVWDAQTFTCLLTLLLSQYDVGTIPPVLDSVTAGSVSSMRCHQCRHLILLGAAEGALPGYCGSAGILSDQERDQLRRLGVPLTGGSMEGLQAEFADIYGVFCGACDSVMLTCGTSEPSFVYRRLATMAGSEAAFSSDMAVTMRDPQDAAAMLIAKGNASAAAVLGIDETCKNLMKRSRYTLGKVDRKHISALYGNMLRLSASQVDRQAECRFSYFLRYGLRAKERKEATVDPAEFGTYVHAVLEHTAREVMARGGFRAVSLEQTNQIAMDYSSVYVKERFGQLDSLRLAHTLEKNLQELQMVVGELWQELNASEFEPVDFELAFGDGEQMPPIRIPGRSMDAQLRGFVDRVDHWNDGYNDYFRVVDYKTGAKNFDYCNVFNGIGLQMLLYMFALEQGGHEALGQAPRAVGVQYFPARAPFVSADGMPDDAYVDKKRSEGFKRKGLLLADEHVLEAMEPEGAASRLCCRVKKDGQITGDVMDRQQLQLLRRYVMWVLGELVDEIASGVVDPNPYTRGTTGACTYCPYGAVCHSDSVAGRRNYKTMSAQRFWEEMEKELNRHG